MTKVDLSIISVSYNTRQIMQDCLESILKYTKGLNYEIIAVDNGSTDGSLEMLRDFSRKHSELILVDAHANVGFGRGNNLGVKQAKGEYILFLNSDTLLFDNALKSAVDYVRKHPKIGAYSCQLLNADHSFQPSGGHFPTLGNLLAWQFFIDDLPLVGRLISSFHPQRSSYDNNQELDWVTGAFMIVPRKLFDQVGGFDEKIFMYTEEMELCYRFSKLGYVTAYRSKPAIVHLGGASNGSVFAITSEVKYMIYFWQKHMPAWQLPLVKFAFLMGSLLRLLIFGIIKGDEKARRAYLQTLRLII